MGLDVEQAGDAGPLVVAVHGIQGTRGAWRSVVQDLAKDHRLVLPNLRGRAAAARALGAAEHTLESYADDLAAVLRAHVGDEPFVLAGWSLGVSITLQTLLRGDVPQPAGVVLVSGTPWLAGAAWFDGDDHAALLASTAARRVRLSLQDHADDTAAAWTWQAIRHTDQRPLLPAIATPALVIHGRDDDDCPLPHGQMLADGLRAPLLVLDGIGHNVLARAGDTVAAQMRAFTGRVLTA